MSGGDDHNITTEAAQQLFTALTALPPGSDKHAIDDNRVLVALQIGEYFLDRWGLEASVRDQHPNLAKSRVDRIVVGELNRCARTLFETLNEKALLRLEGYVDRRRKVVRFEDLEGIANRFKGSLVTALVPPPPKVEAKTIVWRMIVDGARWLGLEMVAGPIAIIGVILAAILIASLSPSVLAEALEGFGKLAHPPGAAVAEQAKTSVDPQQPNLQTRPTAGAH